MTDVVREQTTPGTKVAYLLAQFFGLKNPISIWNAVDKAMKTAGIDWRDNANLVTAAFKRIDANAGMTFNDIVHLIAHEYSTDELKKAFDAAREEGRQEEIKARGFLLPGGYLLPNAKEMTAYCQQNYNRLGNDWSRTFVTGMIDRMKKTPSKRLSPKQIINLGKIYIELGGEV
jgi:hypothetical protein